VSGALELILVRHGETVWNRERRVQGWLDSPLTGQGIEQARRYGITLAELLGDLRGWRFVASPLGRAWQTAVILVETLGLEPGVIECDPLLREMTWGAWDGLTAAEIEARDPALWAARLADRWTVPPPNGGETQADILVRARSWLDRQDGRPAVVIGHGAFGRALRVAYTGEPAERMLELDEPQDALFRLRGGTIERVPCR
jgi:probable phosphoglycerate mutase